MFSDLVDAVKIYNPKYSVFGNSAANKTDFLTKTLSEIKSNLDGSNLTKCFPEEYANFYDIFSHLHHKNLEAGNQLFCCADNTTFKNMGDEHVLAMTYTLLYKHRNRCAHNTLSYQTNIPTFQELNDEYIQKYYNVFLFMAILIVIDKLLIQVYRKYQKVLLEF